MQKEGIWVKTRDIYTSSLTFIVITFFLNILYDSMLMQFLALAGLCALMIVKILVYSGILGHIIDVATGQDVVISPQGVLRNTKDHWLIYLLAALGPLGVHFVLVQLASVFSDISLHIFYAHSNILVLYFFASWVLARKFKSASRMKAPSGFSFKHIGVLLVLYFFELGFFYLPYLIDVGRFDLQNVIFFGRESLRYLQFIYIVCLMRTRYPSLSKGSATGPAKELLLVNPLSGGVLDSFGALLYRRNPAAFVVLKGLTPKDYRVTVFNQYLWRKRYYRGDCLVAITSFTNNTCRAYKIAKEFKKRGAKVILGGPHSGCLPFEALEFCDSVVTGEAEGIWPEIIRDYEKGTLQRVYKGPRVREFHPEVHAQILRSPLAEMKDYIETTRGCKYRCDFCSVPSLCGGNLKKKRIEEVVAILKKLKKRYRRFYFIDNNIYSDPLYARELFLALKPLKIKWAAGCTIDIVKHPEDLKLAKESGCEGLLFGYEIMADSQEKEKGGKYSLAEKYIEYSRVVKKMGLKIKGSFIIGWEQDRWITLLKLWLFSWRINPQLAVVNVLTPLPGSQLFEDLLAQNRITNLNWKKYAFDNLVFRHKYLNNRLLSVGFHYYRMLVLLTTSKTGYAALGILILTLMVYQGLRLIY